ncbi:MAG: maleylpyruvate isomerase family mycothiol-dependent enzyme [Acidimicrobiales bacterium]
MNRARTVEMLRAEREETAEFLDSLGPEDWRRSSLCDDWTVLDVTAHLASVVGLTRRGLLGRALRYGTGTDGANARSATAYAEKGTAHLIGTISDPGVLGLGFFHPQWALCETVVHHQDIRRALGRPRSIPGERLGVAIDVLLKMPFLTGRPKSQQPIAVVASDIELDRGQGPELGGRAEALLMVLAGRLQALPEVTGEAKPLFENPAGDR